MKKILYIGNNLSRDGKYTPTLVTLSHLLKTEGYTVQIASNIRNKYLRIFDMLWLVLRNVKYSPFVLIDTFGTSSFYYAYFVSQFCRLFSLPYIPILHGGSLPVRLKTNPRISKSIFKNSYENCTPSEYLKEALLKHGYRAQVIPNILDIPIYNYKERIKLKPKLLFVRAFQEIYNPTMAVRVLYEVKKKYPTATLCMIGPILDNSFEETQLLANELKVEDSIQYTGSLLKEEWHSIAEGYDIFINTTTIDNTPVSVMEAMALGLPVVSTNVGGIPYLLDEGRDACLVNSDDHNEMAERIVDLIEGRIDGVSMVQNARNKVEQFDWSVVRNLWFQLFKETPVQKPLYARLYHSSPVFVQNLMISIYGAYWKDRRFGGKFKKYLQEFKERETFSEGSWNNYQTHELRKLLVHAYTTVPFYTKLYTEHGFCLEDFEKFDLKDLNKLPYLEKEDLRKFGKTTLLSTKKKKGTFVASSGSSGTPVSVFLSRDMHRKWNAAYESRVRNWAGVHYKLSRGMIGGRRILDSQNPRPPYYRYNYAEKQLYLSAYFINQDTTSNYLEGMFTYHIDYLVGYAMSIYLLAEQVLKCGLEAPQLKAVLTSSEQLTIVMRTTIEKVFKCKVYDAYSGVEACGLISENTDGELLFSPDTGIMEVLDENGEPVKNGEEGEVIATGLLNFDQPLIRYRIGDRVRMAVNQQTNSGMQMPIIERIEGRIEDVVIAKNGSKMVRFHGVFVDVPKLIAGQIEQFSIEEVGINLIVEKDFDVSYELLLEKRLQSQLGSVHVKFIYLEKVPKNKNGKFQAVISHLPK